MLNIEKYADEIRKIGDIGAVAVRKGGKVGSCHDANCNECLFYGKACELELIEWLLKEYKEKPEVTESEYHFCKMLGCGALLRQKSGELNWRPSIHIDVCVDMENIERDLHYCREDFKFEYIKQDNVSIQELIEIYEEAHGIQK